MFIDLKIHLFLKRRIFFNFIEKLLSNIILCLQKVTIDFKPVLRIKCERMIRCAFEQWSDCVKQKYQNEKIMNTYSLISLCMGLISRCCSCVISKTKFTKNITLFDIHLGFDSFAFHSYQKML